MNLFSTGCNGYDVSIRARANSRPVHFSDAGPNLSAFASPPSVRKTLRLCQSARHPEYNRRGPGGQTKCTCCILCSTSPPLICGRLSCTLRETGRRPPPHCILYTFCRPITLLKHCIIFAKRACNTCCNLVFLFCQINLWHCRQAFRMATSSCYGGVATAFQTVPGVSGFPVRPALCLRRIVAARQRTMQHAKRPGAIGGSPDCVPLAYSEKAGALRAHWPAASGVWQPAFNAEVCLWMSP